MSAFFAITGSVCTEDCQAVYDIVDSLESLVDEISITVEPHTVGGDGKPQTILLIEIDGSENANHVGIKEFVNKLQELSPFATSAGVFKTNSDGFEDTVWIGMPKQVEIEQLERKIERARKALNALPDDTRKERVMAEFRASYK